MGIFSSKRRHYVDTNVVRVVPDDMVPNAMTTALVNSLFGGPGVVAAIQDQALNGSFRKFEKMYKYAASGEYFYGLPDATVSTSSDGHILAKAAIESEVGGTVVLDYLHYRPLNNVHAAWKLIFEAGDYDHDTNELPALSVIKGFTVYLSKIVAVHGTSSGLEPEQSSLGTWGSSTADGTTPTQPEWTDPAVLRNLVIGQEIKVVDGADEGAEIHYVWLDGAGDLQTEFYLLDLSAYDTDKEYYQARYTYGGDIGYWIYDPATGTHEDLDAIYATPDYIAPGTYFPFAVFRSEGANRATDALMETDEYITTQKLLSFLDIDFREVGDSIHEDADIEDVDQAVMMMGVPITTSNDVEMDYLFRYFSSLHESLPLRAKRRFDYSVAPRLDSQFGLSGAPDESYAVDITDADFRMTLSFDAIEKRLKAGNIGAVGTLTNTLVDITSPSTLFADGVDEGIAGMQTRYIRKQITPSIYEEIRVVNPKLRYHIYRSLGAEGSADDGKLLIPLDYSVVREMPVLAREKLYYRSLHMVFNSHVTQRVAWYQSGWFGTLLTIIAVVITIWTLGATWKSIAVAMAYGTATALAVAAFNAIVALVIVPMVVKFVFTEVAEEIGVEAAFWIAVAAALAGGYKIANPNSQVLTATAQNLLTTANGLLAGAQEELASLFSDYRSDLEDFGVWKSQKLEELEEAKSLLGTSLRVDPFAFIGLQPMVLFGEPPEAYYERTVHSGNVGVRSTNIVQNFVNNSLRLPTMHETIGDSFYV